jgi:hypothetical protein
MAFTSFKNIGEVLKKYQLKVKRINFVRFSPLQTAPDILKSEIVFSLEEGQYKHSEAAICEQLIHPVLRTLWRTHFLKEMLLWSHTQFSVNETLTGIPDYVFAQRTEYENELLEAPIFLMVEAKKDNFEEAWGQCAAEMVAAQKANDNVSIPIYGCVSNGKIWEFAQLNATHFIKNPDYFDILDLDKLYSVLYFMLLDTKNQWVSN